MWKKCAGTPLSAETQRISLPVIIVSRHVYLLSKTGLEPSFVQRHLLPVYSREKISQVTPKLQDLLAVFNPAVTVADHNIICWCILSVWILWWWLLHPLSSPPKLRHLMADTYCKTTTSSHAGKHVSWDVCKKKVKSMVAHQPIFSV